MEHLPGEFSRLRVLLTGMIGSDQDEATGQLPFPSVTKLRLAAWRRTAILGPRLQERLKGDPPQGNEDTGGAKQFEFPAQVPPAILKLGWQRLVRGWRTAQGCRDETIRECQTVLSITRSRLVCETKPVECPEKPVTAPITGKHPACTIAAVGRRREAHKDKGGCRVAERRDRPTPVLFMLKTPYPGARDLLAPGYQSGTASAMRNAFLQRLDFTPRVSHRWSLPLSRTA